MEGGGELVVYMKITNDEYEFPVAVADSLAELARILKVPKNNISSAMSHARRKKQRCQYIKVLCEDE